MYARVVRFEGANGERLEEAASPIRSEAEDDYNRGDQTLNGMDSPGPGMGQRVAVEKYEVGARLEV
jgi:hypothetical protein